MFDNDRLRLFKVIVNDEKILRIIAQNINQAAMIAREVMKNTDITIRCLDLGILVGSSETPRYLFTE